VAAASSATVKRVALELGGKSASVLLADADFEKAVKGTVSACFLNSGQTCSAHTRMLVPHSRFAEAKELARMAAQTYTVGDPLADNSRLGPLVSAAQRDRVVDYINKGLEQGMELVCGGPEAPHPTGFYVQPTVFATDDSKAILAQEEVFGPVLTIVSYQDEEDAVRIANDSMYGLGGGVWAGSDEAALRVARRIRTGQVDINGGPFNPQAPFGGYKQSGTGRENGVYGLEEYLQYKSLQFKAPA
jgi:acyl-CoA reductase-like NAD-dependent aldehyde dehydrogenase